MSPNVALQQTGELRRRLRCDGGNPPATELERYAALLSHLLPHGSPRMASPINSHSVNRRIAQATVIAMLMLSLASRRLDSQELVDIGGHKLEIVRSGQGAPTVVFESGITDLRLWSGVQPRVAEFASTISYSHAGIGGSQVADAGRGRRSVARTARTSRR